MNKKETSAVLSLIATWWPEFKYSGTPMIDGWAQLFTENNVTLVEARAALSVLVKTGSTYAPNAPAIIQAVANIRTSQVPHREPTIEERWVKLVEWASRGLSIATVNRKCSARTWRALEFAGGWQALKTSTVEHLPFMRQAFIKAYQSAETADQRHENGVAAIEHTETLKLIQETAKRLER